LKKAVYKIKEEVFQYPGMSGWYFVYVSKKESKEIKEKYGEFKRGFGSLPVVVTVGKTSWKTSIFPEKRSRTYFLPLKAAVRKKERIIYGEKLSYSIKINI